MLSDPAGNTPSSHRNCWDSSSVETTPRLQELQRGSGDTKVPWCRQHPDPKAHIACTYPGSGLSPGSELPGSWRSSAAPPWPQQCLGSPGGDRWSWSEVAPQSCGRSCRCGCRRCWEAGKLQAQWQSDRAIHQTCSSLITVLCFITTNDF